jgi:hypothetical protein
LRLSSATLRLQHQRQSHKREQKDPEFGFHGVKYSPIWGMEGKEIKAGRVGLKRGRAKTGTKTGTDYSFPNFRRIHPLIIEKLIGGNWGMSSLSPF